MEIEAKGTLTLLTELAQNLDKIQLSHHTAYEKPYGFRFFPMGHYLSFGDAFENRWQPGRSALLHIYGVRLDVWWKNIDSMELMELACAFARIYSDDARVHNYNTVTPTRFKAITCDQSVDNENSAIVIADPATLNVSVIDASHGKDAAIIRNTGFKVLPNTTDGNKFDILLSDWYTKPVVKLKGHGLRSIGPIVLRDSILDIGFGGTPSSTRDHFALQKGFQLPQSNNLASIFASNLACSVLDKDKIQSRASVVPSKFEFQYGQRNEDEVIRPYQVSKSFHEQNIKDSNNPLFVTFAESANKNLFSIRKCLALTERCKIRNYRYRPRFIDMSEFDRVESSHMVHGANIYLPGWLDCNSEDSEDDLEVSQSVDSGLSLSHNSSLKRSRDSSCETDDESGGYPLPRPSRPRPVSLTETKSCLNLARGHVTKRLFLSEHSLAVVDGRAAVAGLNHTEPVNESKHTESTHTSNKSPKRQKQEKDCSMSLPDNRCEGNSDLKTSPNSEALTKPEIPIAPSKSILKRRYAGSEHNSGDHRKKVRFA